MAEIISVVLALLAHLYYLLHTTFVDWPEMLLYPWLQSKGLLYYRDVVIPFPPFINYLLSLFYGVLGFSPVSERIISYIFIILTDILIYLIVRALVRDRFIALMSLLFFIFWQPIFYGNSLWHETILTPVFLALFMVVLSYITKPSVQKAWLLGLVFTALTLMKQTAIWPIAVTVLYLLLTMKNRLFTIGHLFIAASCVIAGHLFIWLIYALFGAGKEYLFWVYQFPLRLSDANNLYLIAPSRGDIVLLIPAFLPLIMLLFLYKSTIPVRFLMFFTAALFLMALPRWGIFRLQPALACAAVGFGLFLSSRRRIVWWVTLVFVVIFGLRSASTYLTFRDSMQPQFFDKTYQDLVTFGKRLDRPFFVLGNYDYLYIGLDSKPTVLPWMQLLPWNVQIPGNEDRVIASLEAQKTPYILYIPYHQTGYYLDYVPKTLLLYVQTKYEKIAPLPAKGGYLYQRK